MSPSENPDTIVLMAINSTAESKALFKKHFVISLWVLFLYCLCRYVIYSQVAVVDFESWLRRDSLSNFPRILCFLLLIYFVLRDRTKELLPNLGGVQKALFFGFCILLSVVIRFFMAGVTSYPFDLLILAILSSFVVGFFEEALFRGGIFDSLSGWLGAKAAVLCSSVLFVLFHIQAQNVKSFPLIFLLGIVFALMRRDGVSLFVLAMIHSLYDSVILILQPSEENWLMLYVLEFCFFGGVLILYFLAYQSKRIERTKVAVSG